MVGEGEGGEGRGVLGSSLLPALQPQWTLVLFTPGRGRIEAADPAGGARVPPKYRRYRMSQGLYQVVAPRVG